MKRLIVYLAITVFIAYLAAGCSDKQNAAADSEKVKRVAWEFVEAKGWEENGFRQNAEVTEVTVDHSYELLTSSLSGKKAWSVSFKEKENTVTGIPSILIDMTTHKVIGYMPVE